MFNSYKTQSNPATRPHQTYKMDDSKLDPDLFDETEDFSDPTIHSRVRILTKAFHQYDKDGSGAIGHNELTHLLGDLGWPIHPGFVSRTIEALDQNCTGEINLKEFMQWTKFAYLSRVLYPNKTFPPSPRSRFRCSFSRIKSSHSGTYSRSSSGVFYITENESPLETLPDGDILCPSPTSRESNSILSSENSGNGSDSSEPISRSRQRSRRVTSIIYRRGMLITRLQSPDRNSRLT